MVQYKLIDCLMKVREGICHPKGFKLLKLAKFSLKEYVQDKDIDIYPELATQIWKSDCSHQHKNCF